MRNSISGVSHEISTYVFYTKGNTFKDIPSFLEFEGLKVILMLMLCINGQYWAKIRKYQNGTYFSFDSRPISAVYANISSSIEYLGAA